MPRFTASRRVFSAAPRFTPAIVADAYVFAHDFRFEIRSPFSSPALEFFLYADIPFDFLSLAPYALRRRLSRLRHIAPQFRHRRRPSLIRLRQRFSIRHYQAPPPSPDAQWLRRLRTPRLRHIPPVCFEMMPPAIQIAADAACCRLPPSGRVFLHSAFMSADAATFSVPLPPPFASAGRRLMFFTADFRSPAPPPLSAAASAMLRPPPCH